MHECKDSKELWLSKMPVGVLARAMFNRATRKIARKLGFNRAVERSVLYNGVEVFDNTDLDGGGWMHGQDFIRCLLELGFGRCESLCEFGAGPGYIGYSLLANGFCDRLTLIDINPAAIEMANRTAVRNGIEHLVTVIQSDCLDQVPDGQRWDLVVSNPPQFVPAGRYTSKDAKNPRKLHVAPNPARAYDADWTIHDRFYRGIKKYMNPGGYVVFQECALPFHPRSVYMGIAHEGIFIRTDGADGEYEICLDDFREYDGDKIGEGSTPDIFRPMIERGGGEYVCWRPAINMVGQHDGMYYVVSRWNADSAEAGR